MESAVDELTRALMEVHREMRAILGTVARGAGLTAQQIEMLCVLENRHPSFGELAELLGCDKTNITGMADRLARRGLVARQHDPRDRRVTRLQLTDHGRSFGTTLKRSVAAAVAERYGDLRAPERAALAALTQARQG
ncbi:hypothetical protein GCM10023321_39380 [Pseudonocardia eucalypti]|uniref:HTH marR-type domain-containing protein n=1 Tax=Pseudonocardia eucalypti TaxID=648755 RepID=A0ABP9QB94_9PSEU